MLFGLALFVELAIARARLGPEGDLHRRRPPSARAFGTPEQIGELLLTKFLLPFEVASFLLLIAAVGAVVLARRRGGIGADEADRVAVMDFRLPPGHRDHGRGGRRPRRRASRSSSAPGGGEPEPLRPGGGW